MGTGGTGMQSKKRVAVVVVAIAVAASVIVGVGLGVAGTASPVKVGDAAGERLGRRGLAHRRPPGRPDHADAERQRRCRARPAPAPPTRSGR